MRTLIYLIICLGVLQITSCIKPTNNDPITETTPGAKVIDKTITNSMYFKKGSYWIYEGDRGEYDSMWIDSKSNLAFETNTKAQEFNTYIYSSIEQNSRVIWCQYRQFEPDTQYRIQIASYFRGSSSGLINADIFRRSKGSTNTCITCTGDTAILLPTYSLNGKEYKNVWKFISKKFRQVYQDDSNPQIGEYYLAQDIGLIDKQEGGALHYFKLKRYHIVK